MTALPPWADSLTNARIRRLLGAVLARLPAHDRAALDGLVGAACDDLPPEPGRLASVDVADAELRARVNLGGLARIQDDRAASWAVAHELAHVVMRHNLLAPIAGLRYLAGADMGEGENRMIEAHLEDAADFLAGLWGFCPERDAFRAAFPLARRARWQGREP